MYEIKHIKDVEKNEVRKLSEELYQKLQMCPIYNDSTMVVVNEKGWLCGAGIMACDSEPSVDSEIIFDADIYTDGGEKTVEITDMIISRMISDLQENGENAFKKVLRVFCKGIVAPDFYLREGFILKKTLFSMEREITEEDLIDEEFSEYMTIEAGDDDLVEEYLAVNSRAFGTGVKKERLLYEMKTGSDIIINREEEIISSAEVKVTGESAFIDRVFTDLEYREQGYAAEMLDYLHDRLYGMAVKNARLTVYGDNYKAINLYLEAGYEVSEVFYEMRTP